MCGRFVKYTPSSMIAKRYWGHDKSIGDQVAHYNITPGRQIAAVHYRMGEEIIFDLSMWGYKPSWAGEGAPVPINARIEKLRSKYYAEAFSKRRCVIPANGWYEWKKTDQGKEPYYITKPDQEREEAIFFAGIFEVMHGVNTCCAIITEPAADRIKHIHERQPVVLDPSCINEWIDPGLTDTAQLKDKVVRLDPDRFDFWRVSTDVNKPDNNRPDLIDPIT